MTRKDWAEITTSLLTGAGVGAALMYLLDPEIGRNRRQYLARRAEDVWEGASEGLHDTLSGLGESVRGASERVGGAVDEAWGQLTERAQKVGDRARGWGQEVSDYGRSVGRRAYRGARQQLPENDSGYSGTTTMLAALGALTLGAGLLYLLDPTSGRRRRALIRDKGVHYAREAQDAVTGTAKDLSNRAQGVYHEASKAVSGAWQQASGTETGGQSVSGGTARSIPGTAMGGEV